MCMLFRGGLPAGPHVLGPDEDFIQYIEKEYEKRGIPYGGKQAFGGRGNPYGVCSPELATRSSLPDMMLGRGCHSLYGMVCCITVQYRNDCHGMV